MSTVTAQILVGHPDTLHAGIWPTHGPYLFENSRPAWVRAPLALQVSDDPARRASTWRELAASTTVDERVELARACRASAARCKAVVTVLEGSSLAGRLAPLEDYPVDIEVCPSRSVREVAGWKGEIVRRGTL